MVPAGVTALLRWHCAWPLTVRQSILQYNTTQYSKARCTVLARGPHGLRGKHPAVSLARTLSSGASDPKWSMASRVVCARYSWWCRCSRQLPNEASRLRDCLFWLSLLYHCDEAPYGSRLCLDTVVAPAKTDAAGTLSMRSRHSTARMRCTVAFRLSVAPRVHQSVRKSCVMSCYSCGRSSSQPTAVKRPHRAPPKNEDWSKIRDPVERRKMQNRIAQRNYRKERADTGLHSFAKARVGKRRKQRLALLRSRVSSERTLSESDSRTDDRPCGLQPLTNVYPHGSCTASLNPCRDSHLQGNSSAPSRERADGLPDALSSAIPSSPPTVSLSAEAATRPVDRSLRAPTRLSTAAVCLTAPCAPNHFSAWEHHTSSDSSPFEEGYLAMNGMSAAQRWHQ